MGVTASRVEAVQLAQGRCFAQAKDLARVHCSIQAAGVAFANEDKDAMKDAVQLMEDKVHIVAMKRGGETDPLTVRLGANAHQIKEAAGYLNRTPWNVDKKVWEERRAQAVHWIENAELDVLLAMLENYCTCHEQTVREVLSME